MTLRSSSKQVGNFEVARAKVNWSREHVTKFFSYIEDYRFNNPVTLIPESRYKQKSLSVTLDRLLPLEAMLTLGDAVHNLRTALDHAFFVVAKIDNPNLCEKKIQFPISEDKRTFSKYLEKQNLKQDLFNLIEYSEPYLGGKGEILYYLHRLDIVDKHRSILSSACSFQLSGLKEIYTNGTVTRIPPVNLYCRTDSEKTGWSSPRGDHYAGTIIKSYDGIMPSIDRSDLRLELSIFLPESPKITQREASSALRDMLWTVDHYDQKNRTSNILKDVNIVSLGANSVG